MILSALKELAEREHLIQSPALEQSRVDYLVRVDESGHGEIITAGDGSKDSRGIRRLIPRHLPGARRTGAIIDPRFLTDNASFVFGINAFDIPDKYPDSILQKRFNSFLNLIRICGEETKDAAVDAALKFLNSFRDGHRPKIPETVKSNDIFVFQFARDPELLVHERPSVLKWLESYRIRLENPVNENLNFTCLISGLSCIPVDKHPPIKQIPGGTTSGVALVSFNEEVYESYGLKRNENAPISRESADAYTEALKRLLDSKYQKPGETRPMQKCNLRLSENCVVVFWGKHETGIEDLMLNIMEAPDTDTVETLYKGPWLGKEPKLDASAFYALTLTGGQGRATIRGWFESTVGEVANHLSEYIADITIVPDSSKKSGVFPLRKILEATAVRQDFKGIHPGLATELFECILNGRPFPRLLIDLLLRRNRFERRVTWERAAGLKAYFNRLFRKGRMANLNKEVDKVLDKECKNTGYRLGRLFSVMEMVQERATHPGSTIRDRFWGAASATPVVVFPQLFRKIPHHLAKLENPSYYEKVIQEIVNAFSVSTAFPSTLSLEDQGLFALGYYHQRQDLFTKHKPDENGKGE